MLKKSYILSFIIDAKFNIQNKIFVISVLGLGGVVFHSVWGVIPPLKETLLEIRGRNVFTVLGRQITQFAPATISLLCRAS